MTVLAGVGEAGVHGVAGGGEVGLVAGEALARCAGVPCPVAGRALDGAVRAEELESGLIVIEDRRLPGGYAVAVLAAGGEAGVHRIPGAVELPLVAGEALDRRRGVAVTMAGDAVDRAMGAVEGEGGPVVIEGRRLPGSDTVAGLARGREASVAGTGSARERRFVTAETLDLALLPGEVERRMAELACRIGVRADEVEAGRRMPVGQRRPQWRPALRRVTLGAFVGERAVRTRRARLSRHRCRDEKRDEGDRGAEVAGLRAGWGNRSRSPAGSRKAPGGSSRHGVASEMNRL